MHAALTPPADHRFTGAFFYQDDVFQYLSFVEQASRGHLVFRNKFDPQPHSPVLVNLEWTAAGVLARGLGGDPRRGLQVLRILAIGALVLGCARLLRLAGVREGFGWALSLVMVGSGLGWLRLAQGAPGWQIPDILTGLYAFHQSLMNAHFVVGTALLIWSVVLHLEWRAGGRLRWHWIAAGWATGLARPYDLVTLMGIIAALALVDAVRHRRPDAARSTLDLAWFLPVLVYYALVMKVHPSYVGWTGVQSQDLNPPLKELAFAVAPAAALVATFGRRLAPDRAAVRVTLGLWSGTLLLLVASYDAPITKQNATSLGTALLLLAACAVPPRVLPWACLLLSPTSAFLVWRTLHPLPHWFAHRDYWTAVEHLRGQCRDGELALAPTDLSLLIAGLTPCSVSVGHRAGPEFETRVAEGTRFYDPATPPAWRVAYFRAIGADWVLLPRGAGGWLGVDSGLTRGLTTPLLEVWGRGGDADARGSTRPADEEQLAPPRAAVEGFEVLVE